MNPAILIAGAGDLGGRIAAGLRACGHDVTALARRPRDDGRIIALDLSEPIAGRLPDRFGTLVICLAPTARDEAAYRSVFIDAPSRLLDALPSARRVVFVSSTAVYGDHAGATIDETAICRPTAFNGRCLLDAERQLQASGRDLLILRPGGLYGPGRDRLIRRVRSGEPWPEPALPTDSHRIHIDDAAAAAAHLIECGASGCFNLVDDCPVPLGDVLDWLADRIGLPRLPRCPATTAEDRKRLSNARLRSTGFCFRYPDFRAGYDAQLR